MKSDEPYNTYIARAVTCGFKSSIIATRITIHILLTQYRFRLFPFRSPLLRELTFVLFSCGYWEVSLHHVPLTWILNFNMWWLGMTPAGFLHSDTPGSKLTRQLPENIVACNVLHRLFTPRHPPYALTSLLKWLYYSIRLLMRNVSFSASAFRYIIDRIINGPTCHRINNNQMRFKHFSGITPVVYLKPK